MIGSRAQASLGLKPLNVRKSQYARCWWCPHRPNQRVHFAGGIQECLRCGEIIEEEASA